MFKQLSCVQIDKTTYTSRAPAPHMGAFKRIQHTNLHISPSTLSSYSISFIDTIFILELNELVFSSLVWVKIQQDFTLTRHVFVTIFYQVQTQRQWTDNSASGQTTGLVVKTTQKTTALVNNRTKKTTALVDRQQRQWTRQQRQWTRQHKRQQRQWTNKKEQTALVDRQERTDSASGQTRKKRQRQWTRKNRQRQWTDKKKQTALVDRQERADSASGQTRKNRQRQWTKKNRQRQWARKNRQRQWTRKNRQSIRTDSEWSMTDSSVGKTDRQ